MEKNHQTQVLAHLKNGKILSQVEAIHHFDCYRLYLSYEQCNLSDDKAKAIFSVCGMLVNGALEDIELITSKTKLDISKIISEATSILYTTEELSDFYLSEDHTAAAINRLFLATGTVKESLEVAVDAVMQGGSHNA